MTTKSNTYINKTINSYVRDDGDNYSAEIELAGYEKSDIKISATNESLKIDAKNDKRSKSLTLYLENLVSIDSIRVNYKNGLLSFILPKKSVKDIIQIKVD